MLGENMAFQGNAWSDRGTNFGSLVNVNLMMLYIIAHVGDDTFGHPKKIEST